MSRPNAEVPVPEVPAPRGSFWRRWGWRLLLSAAILAAVAGYHLARYGQVGGFVVLPHVGADGPWKLVVYLPGVGSVESFRKDQSPARAICRKLNLPELPDISSIDADGQKQFHAAFSLLRTYPKGPEKYVRLGQLCQAQRFPELAVRLYRRAVEIDPDCFEARYQLGLRLAADGDARAADAEFARASEINPAYAPVWMQRAWRAVEQGQAQAASGFAGQYIARRPDDPFGYVQRAQINSELGRWEAMQQDLEQAAALGPIGKQGHRLLSVLYRQLGRTEDSRFHSLMSAEDQPAGEMDDPIGVMVRRLETFREPLLARLSGLADAKRHAEAVELADDVFAKYQGHQDFGFACGKIAECYRQLGHSAKALFYAQHACRAMPDKPAPHASLALIHVQAGGLKEALAEANKALEIDPNYHVALYARGLTLTQLAIRDRQAPASTLPADAQNWMTRAVADLERCVELKPVNFAYLVALAHAQGLTGQFDRAHQVLATAARINPGDETVRAYLAKARSQQSFWPSPP